MRKKIFFLLFSSIMCGCTEDPNPVISQTGNSYLDGPGVFIINEGNFRSGNGSLSFFSYDSAKIFNQVFLNINQRPLGDIPYSMCFSGNKGYIVVNNSGKIEIVDKDNLTSLTSINGLISPRYFHVVSGNKAYVSSLYSDSVTIINLSENLVAGYINIKHSSESIVTADSKVYISSWAGNDKIFVIDTHSDLVTDSIIVGMEPESMVIDKNQMLWVLCNGGWQRNYFAELIGINTVTNTISKRFKFSSISDSPSCLQIDGSGETLYYLLSGVRRMGIDGMDLPSEPFIYSGMSNFYKLGINPENDEIFVTDAGDYQQRGLVLQFKNDGTLVSSFQADIIPGFMLFKTSQIKNRN